MRELDERLGHGVAPRDHTFSIGFHDGHFYVIAMPNTCLFYDTGSGSPYYLGSVKAFYANEDGTLGDEIRIKGDFKLMINGNRWEWDD